MIHVGQRASYNKYLGFLLASHHPFCFLQHCNELKLTGKDTCAGFRSGGDERTGEGAYRGTGSVLAEVGLADPTDLAAPGCCEAEVGRPLDTGGRPTYPRAYCVGISARAWF